MKFLNGLHLLVEKLEFRKDFIYFADFKVSVMQYYWVLAWWPKLWSWKGSSKCWQIRVYRHVQNNWTLTIWVLYKQIKSNWTKLNWVEPSWTELNRVEPSWTELNRVGTSWTELNRVEPSWTELNQVEPSWTELNRVETSWTELNRVEPSWTELYSIELSWIRLVWPSISIFWHYVILDKGVLES